MDGLHDLGGVEGFGPVDQEDYGRTFKYAWEGRMNGIAAAMARPPGWSIDWFRHARECVRPEDYLTRSYYDQWNLAYAAMLVDSGSVSIEELASGKASLPVTPPKSRPMGAAEVLGKVHPPHDPHRPGGVAPRYRPGDAVRTRPVGFAGHTRLPRYARDKPAVIHACYGRQLLPDAVAAGREEAEPLYCVMLRAKDLWIEAADSPDEVFLDLWESYLEPA